MLQVLRQDLSYLLSSNTLTNVSQTFKIHSVRSGTDIKTILAMTLLMIIGKQYTMDHRFGAQK
jgi:hypothetical protein